MKEVSIEAIFEVGDCPERNLERSRLRYLRGIGLGNEAQENGILGCMKVWGELGLRRVGVMVGSGVEAAPRTISSSDGVSRTGEPVALENCGG